MIKISKELKDSLKSVKKTWLITGVGGFIGSSLLETLITHNQRVIGVDNFITGKRANIESAINQAKEVEKKEFKFYEGCLTDIDTCRKVIKNVDIVLHQAALGSVPRSINDPVMSNLHNNNGFLNMIHSCRESDIENFIYASSSSVYGDHEDLPKKENRIGNQMSPYAVSKYTNELYANAFESSYGYKSIGLRYFNVFGKRQNPDSAYAAVISRWLHSIIKNEQITIYGDGQTTRDFTHVDNAVEANLRAGLTVNNHAKGQVYNIALNQRISLNDLLELIKMYFSEKYDLNMKYEPKYEDFRKGDIRDSQANIDKARKHLGYEPVTSVRDGIEKTIDWFIDNHRK